jgi:hypothetical protein
MYNLICGFYTAACFGHYFWPSSGNTYRATLHFSLFTIGGGHKHVAMNAAPKCEQDHHVNSKVRMRRLESSRTLGEPGSSALYRAHQGKDHYAGLRTIRVLVHLNKVTQ